MFIFVSSRLDKRRGRGDGLDIDRGDRVTKAQDRTIAHARELVRQHNWVVGQFGPVYQPECASTRFSGTEPDTSAFRLMKLTHYRTL